MTLEELQNKLKSAVNFPSPPAVAQQIIDLASDPDIDIGKVATTISRDPGLTAKVLRVANSPLYSKRRKSENLRQATVVLGLNAVTTLALSFSLVGTYNRLKSTGIDYTRFWRRTILSASAARAFGTLQGIHATEDIFLAALLQDIAVLAIDRVAPELYKGLPAVASHAEQIAHEVKSLGVDHAAVGAWLLTHWRLPEGLCYTVEHSHAPANTDGTSPIGVAARCVALGAECVDFLLAHAAPTDIGPLASHAEEWLDIGPDALAAAMASIVSEIPEIERLFDTALIPAESANSILENARELLTIRNLQALEQVNSLQETTEHLEARAVELEDQQKRDALTGVFGRGHLDRVLDQEFRDSTAGGWPLSVVFVDLDRFKQVNDTYGHPAGDAVLKATAKILMTAARDSDCVARYGGEEFMIVLPGIGGDGAEIVCSRLLERLRAARHLVAGTPLKVTASLGLATHSASTPFANARDLVEAADRAVYVAKKSGRDQLVRDRPARDEALGRKAGSAG